MHEVTATLFASGDGQFAATGPAAFTKRSFEVEQTGEGL